MAYRNAPIHPVLRFIYAFLRFTSWVGMSVFYRRRLILGREHLQFDGPGIVVSNHPSTLMDPLNVGISIRQEMFFLANYSLFKNPVSRWILSRLFCIPVKRKEDVTEGETRDNDAAFEASFQHLEKHGLLYVAAEGVSWVNRYVRPFKTGAARIAFGAERRNQWKLGVKIIPVGLSYDAPTLFRSRVTVEYGAPIDPGPWAEANEQNHEQAVTDFTAEIENGVRVLTLDSGSEAGDSFVNQVEALVRHYHIEILGHSEREAYYLLKSFLTKTIENGTFKANVADYFEAIQTAGLTDAGIAHVRAPKSDLLRRFQLLLLFPFFLIGTSFWFLPCRIPWWLCKRLDLYPGYNSNVKMLAGLFSFPLALWGAWALVFWGGGSSLLAWASLPALFICGYLAELFMDQAQRVRAIAAVRSFQKKNPAEWEKRQEQREQILQAIHLT